MVLEKVIELLAEYKECDSSEIKADSTFDELELDSLDTVDLLMSFEDEFNVQLEMSEEIKTVADIVAVDVYKRQERNWQAGTLWKAV